jgi:4-azaleucine resistance transporter AzlC
LSIGFAAGVIGRTAGLTIGEIALMSILVYAGSAQFIMTGMIASGSTAAAIALTVFLVNLRHFLMSASLAPYFRHLSAWKNAVIGFQLTDETFGVASTRLTGTMKASGWWMFGLNLTAQINWVIATVVGAIFGQWIANPNELGLDFALPAMFIGLLVIQLMERGKLRADAVVAVIAAVLAVACSVWITASAAVMIAIVIAATIGVWIESWK